MSDRLQCIYTSFSGPFCSFSLLQLNLTIKSEEQTWNFPVFCFSSSRLELPRAQLNPTPPSASSTFRDENSSKAKLLGKRLRTGTFRLPFWSVPTVNWKFMFILMQCAPIVQMFEHKDSELHLELDSLFKHAIMLNHIYL
jgi:hypothetical protein